MLHLQRLHGHDFNPHSRVGSDLDYADMTIGYYIFQSTLPRGERLLVSITDKDVIEISIHTPAWGATAKLHKSNFD